MEATKRCGSCRRTLPLPCFNYKNKARKTLQSYCRECSNDAWRKWYSNPTNKAHHLKVLRARRKRRIARNKALVKALKSVPCADCGKRFPPEAMDFDHREDKEELISKLVFTAGEERLRREIAKCDVVCSNCHRVRTARRLRQLRAI